MKETVDIFITVRKNLPLMVGLCLCAYFSYHMVFGKYGYMRLNNLQPIAQAKEKQLGALITKSTNLENKVSLLRPNTLSPDLLEEQVRLILGYNNQDEMILLDR
tara:strand:- start:10874 stop:11185 length:312 start_codon:yes stop_codon:yes gene_type:complete